MDHWINSAAREELMALTRMRIEKCTNVLFSSQVEPRNSPTQWHLMFSPSFSQMPSFLQGELSHGFTESKKYDGTLG